jgi:hypothetical protein
MFDRSCTDAVSSQQQLARSASCSSTRFKLAPQGSGFSCQALKSAGRSNTIAGTTVGMEESRLEGSWQSTQQAGSSSSINREGLLTCNSKFNSSERSTTPNSSSSSSSGRAAPGSLLAISSLSEALLLCPFSGDASAGAMMLATSGFARQEKRAKPQQQQQQLVLQGGSRQAGQATVQQQIEWK